jgi:hypothetical protein
MVSYVTSELILLSFLSVAPHELGTRNALLGAWPNNTDIYLTTVNSTQNHTVAPPRYNWNIVESGIKHQQTNTQLQDKKRLVTQDIYK